MKMRKLGQTSIEIAPLVLGGNVFGWTADKATSFAVLDAFLEAGFNAIDTADVYSAWQRHRAQQREAGHDDHRSRQQGHEVLRPPLARQRPECAVALASRPVGGRVGHACCPVP